ncbi:hypothetical protein SD70_29045 [Gordoniibacillus kamchatkensis]|uniref:DUF1284 domain-containing protein n=1 Tax=Gordoniibacillus kamchatkensis TaxID=1590651 RepID=A0ABR5AAP1_9BACL|nr:DUF1284 domain-containing protein [Paenibacillus sp. VKM B-2647]KIL38046.1 hypothetical protein SD70_29045 [Paenibacillus sp. VKM B-2647]
MVKRSEKPVKLRGHHLLCLLGYRGMGYSAEYAANMNAVHERLRTEPETAVALVLGADDLCSCFPADQPYHCDSDTVARRDAAVLERLGLEPGQSLAWSELLRRIAAAVSPADVPLWCASCPWLQYGVCEEGVALVRAGGGLRPLGQD